MQSLQFFKRIPKLKMQSLQFFNRVPAASANLVDPDFILPKLTDATVWGEFLPAVLNQGMSRVGRDRIVLDHLAEVDFCEKLEAAQRHGLSKTSLLISPRVILDKIFISDIKYLDPGSPHGIQKVRYELRGNRRISSYFCPIWTKYTDPEDVKVLVRKQEFAEICKISISASSETAKDLGRLTWATDHYTWTPVYERRAMERPVEPPKPINSESMPCDSTNRNGWCYDTLKALVEQGPLWDGNVPSKAGRDALIEQRLAVRVVVAGEDGYTAATYAGRDLFRKYVELRAAMEESVEAAKKIQQEQLAEQMSSFFQTLKR